ncbi:MAG: helix-turn-helix domain-containing protein [Geobacter sp.]|nr:helix-turn-helix domain-containing protein [Geobacter sp.]
MTRDKSTYSVQTVEKALDLLEALTDETPPPTLPNLAERLGLSRNKVFRLLATLESRGLVEREEGSGVYRIGLSSVALAQRFISSASLIKHAHPVMEELARKHDEAIYLTVLLGDEVLFLDMVDSLQNVKTTPMVGKRFPFFTNAAGKVLKALESQELLEKLFKRRGRRKDLPDLVALGSELHAIREKGVAVDQGGLGEGVVSVAVTIRDYAGKVICALAMMGPSFRMLTDRIENEIIPSLQEGAEVLSMKFGYARF